MLRRQGFPTVQAPVPILGVLNVSAWRSIAVTVPVHEFVGDPLGVTWHSLPPGVAVPGSQWRFLAEEWVREQDRSVQAVFSAMEAVAAELAAEDCSNYFISPGLPRYLCKIEHSSPTAGVKPGTPRRPYKLELP
jgi:hypothetical protein